MHHPGQHRADWARVGAATLALATAALPAPASAWGRHLVEAAAAEVTIDGAGEAQVTLVVDFRVSGGRLRSLDVELTDPAWLQEGATASVTSLDDDPYAGTPTVTRAEDGSLSLAFERKAAPGAGRYRARISYRTRGTPTDADARVRSLVLPAWNNGVDDARVRLTLPDGGEGVADTNAEADGRVHRTVRRDRELTVIEYRRVHQPQLTPWAVSFRLPGEATHAPDAARRALSRADLPAWTGRRVDARDDAADAAMPWIAALALAALLLGLGRSVRRAAAARRQSAAPCLPLPRAARGLVGASLLLGGAWAAPLSTPLAAAAFLVAVGLCRDRVRAQDRGPVALGAWRSATPDDLTAARRVVRALAAGRESPLATHTAFGAGLACLVLGVAWVSSPSLGLLWLPHVAAMVLAGRTALLSLPEERLLALADVDDRPGNLAFEAVVLEDASGRWIDARLRHTPSVREAGAGLESIEVHAAHRVSPAGVRLDPAWVVTSRRGSPAAQFALARGPLVATVGHRECVALAEGARGVPALLRALRTMGLAPAGRQTPSERRAA